jgi:hypothetical protein
MKHGCGSDPYPYEAHTPAWLSASSDTSDASIEEISKAADDPFVSVMAFGESSEQSRPGRLPNPTRLVVWGPYRRPVMQFKPSDTFALVKRSIALKYGIGLSWLTIDHVDGEFSGPGWGSRCFRDLDDDSTLESSFIGCTGEPFDYGDAGIMMSSSHGPLRVSRSRFLDFIDIQIFGCDRDCELKRRIECAEGTNSEHQRICFRGRELPDDFTLEELGGSTRNGSRYTILRLVVRHHHPIHVSIQRVNGERFLVEVESSDLILEMKARIETQEGISVGDQHLFICGGELQNDAFICDCSIFDGLSLHLVSPKPNDGDPSVRGDAENESVELTVHDLDSNSFSSIVVGRRELVGDAWARLGYNRLIDGLWLGGSKLLPGSTFEEYSIRDGTLLHRRVQSQIFVQLMGREWATFHVSPWDYVCDLQRLIEVRNGTALDRQRLQYAGRVMSSTSLLAEYGIKNDSTLLLWGSM